jgi:hypothetical protein
MNEEWVRNYYTDVAKRLGFKEAWINARVQQFKIGRLVEVAELQKITDYNKSSGEPLDDF